MRKFIKYFFGGIVIVSFVAIIWPSNASTNYKEWKNNLLNSVEIALEDTNIAPDTTKLPYSFNDKDGYVDPNAKSGSGLFLKNPANIQSDIIYDPTTSEYLFTEKIGSLNNRTPYLMTLEEYKKYEFENGTRNYWRQSAKGISSTGYSSFIPQLHFGGEVFGQLFGSSNINIRPQGSAELSFGVQISKIDNPALTEKMRKTTTFDFDEKIQMNVVGEIGDKMKITANYNTEATFDWENQMKLEYQGKEDEIIQKIEGGNVSLPLSGSLISGSQSLFGIKTELKFGKLTATGVFSQQKGKSSVIEVKGGAQINNFEAYADQYEGNKHFFLSQYFYNNYDEALKNLPIINSSVQINRIEVWVTNKSSNFENARNIIGFMDLAEGSGNMQSEIFPANPGVYPNNGINNLYNAMTTTYSNIRNINNITSTLGIGFFTSNNFVGGKDWEKLENARLLSPSEYSLNSRLGFISLNSSLNSDEVLAVAYEYTAGGETYKVGEFSNDGIAAPQTLIVKLIKGTSLTPKLRTWKLMMKNVYSIGAYQINPQDFKLDILYQNDKTGTAVQNLPEGSIKDQKLLAVLNLDKLNSQLDPSPDGTFDFVDGVTINSANGRVYLPMREPFGRYLETKINDANISANYVFKELYDSTQSTARQMAEKNKFFIKGTYQSSSSSDISLNAMNVPQGSVKVIAGGMQLIENQDYTVDYNLGRVKIINQGILESGTPIQISLESNSAFSIQSKTLMGAHLDYKISDDFRIGATVLNLTERPITSKVNIGDEPISNTIWGFDGSYRTDAPFLTRLIDKLPFLETKEKSNITFSGEFAHLIPGHSKAIDKTGTSYIDDFEGTKTNIDIKSQFAWVIASTPQGQPSMFPEGNLNNNLAYGYNRAKIAWYSIDPLFLRNNSLTPNHIKDDVSTQSSHFVREIDEKEIFPNKQSPNGLPTRIAVLNLAYYPQEKGPYNYDALGLANISSGISANGRLLNPISRWGGIMRKLESNDFEAANIEFIEFWVMDPFWKDSTNSGGDLYFNLGNVSEDVLKDSRKSFEDGLPKTETATLVDTTSWGVVPLIQSLVRAFDNETDARKYQDVGLDGLKDDKERTFFKRPESPYLLKIDSLHNIGQLTDSAYNAIINDPSSDNYHYFKGSDYNNTKLSILERYKQFNGLEGNSPVSTGDEPTAATQIPNVEDINSDNTLSETESYFQYKVHLAPGMQVGDGYITDMIETSAKFANGQNSTVKWYQFKVPIYEWENQVGGITDFKSIRFIRMFLKGFEDSVILRFAKLDLVRGEWRKYQQSLAQAGEYGSGNSDATNTGFDVSAVNIEENGKKSPINYVLPPGIDRVIDPTNPQLRQLNEQSMLLKVINLEDGDARAAYKNVSMDVRQYKKLKMEIHAEEISGYPLKDDELSVFIRIGSDYKNNYYEYEIPLKLTPAGSYSGDKDYDRGIVWPADNSFNFYFDVLQSAKQERNNLMREAGSTVSLTKPFQIVDGNNIVRVIGNPNLSNVRTIMIGIRNTKKDDQNSIEDDGLAKSGEVWVNELRLTDFDEEGGWAANARLLAKLADFGTISIAGNTMKPGFGSLEKKVGERNKEDIYQYDISSTLELGKFFPEKSGIRLPMYVGYSEGFRNPQYNPLDPDIKLSVALDNAKNKSARDSIKKMSQSYTQRKSLNFTNIKVGKQKPKPAIYDINNWAVSYAFNEQYSRNITTIYNRQKTYNGGISYNFNNTPKNITPFKNTKFLNKPSLKIIKDFNFYYLPSQIAFRSDMNRQYSEIQLRNINSPYPIDPSYSHDFMWARNYDLKYNLSKSLKFDFNASNTDRIDEPDGRLDKGMPDYNEKRDTILDNIYKLLGTVQYHHNYNLDYTLPINKIPLLSWVSATFRYSGNYDWERGAITSDTAIQDLGNTIRNSNTKQLNPQFNMLGLYNKIGYLNRVNEKFSGKNKNKPQKQVERVNYEKAELTLQKDIPKSINHKLGTEDVDVKFYDSTGVIIKGEMKILTKDRVIFTTKRDYNNVRVVINGSKPITTSLLAQIAEYSARLLMSVTNVSISYSETNGTLLPGYLPETSMLGQQSGGFSAPGLPFAFGTQSLDFANTAAKEGWLTKDTVLNTAWSMTYSENISGRSTIEPFKDFRIELTANRTSSRNRSEYYAYNGTEYDFSNKQYTGNFTMTFNTWRTTFSNSKAFDEFVNNRYTISRRLANEHGQTALYDPSVTDSIGFNDGYGAGSQEVLIPAFLAAYSGKNAEKISLTAFPKIWQVKPNWRIRYDGLSKYQFIKKYFKTVTLDHAYRSTYSVGSFLTNTEFNSSEDIRDLSGNFISEKDINSVSISEQWSPLINIDMTWNNSLITKFEIRKSRSVSLSLSNIQISDNTSNEYIIGLGYRIKDLEFIVKTGGTQKDFKSDLNLRGDLSIRDTKTAIRKVDGGNGQPLTQNTSGQQIITIKVSADYVLSERLNVRLYYDRIANKPKISNSFATTNSNIGISLRFTLAG